MQEIILYSAAEGDGYAGGLEEDVLAKVRKALFCSWLLSMMSHHSDREFLISRWSCECHTFEATRGQFTPTLEGWHS